MRVFKLKEIDSTNNYIKSIENKKAGDIVIAEKQTLGRGRRGNKWFSNEGAALFSFLLEKDKRISIEEYSILSLIVGYSVYEVLKELDKLDFKFKWTNDIYIKDKKISGVLIESFKEFFIIGIGVNLNNNIPNEIKDIAISLKDITGKKYDIECVAKKIVEKVFYNIEVLKNRENWEKMLENINSINYLFGKRIEIYGDRILETGIAGDILESGELEVFVGGEIKKFNIGEIHIER